MKSAHENSMRTASAKRAPRKGSHFEVAKRLGLIGCLDGPLDLAQNLKKYVRRAVRAKYRAR
jgi:hypothetical protein